MESECPIAIIATVCRLPGCTSSPSKLWELLRDTLTRYLLPRRIQPQTTTATIAVDRPMRPIEVLDKQYCWHPANLQFVLCSLIAYFVHPC